MASNGEDIELRPEIGRTIVGLRRFRRRLEISTGFARRSACVETLNVGFSEDMISRISQGNCEIEHYLDLHRLIRTNIVQTQFEVHTRIRRPKIALPEYQISKLGEEVSCLVTSIGIDV